MRAESFNDGWQVRPKVDRFADLTGQGAAWTPVTLPHDAMIGTARSSDAPTATGFFPGGCWEYRKSWDVPAQQSGSSIVLEFEGVYRDAVVTVNGTLAAHRPYGYSNFFVQVDHLLCYGAANEILVRARAGDDTRWYSGAGIHRNVWLLRAGRVHLAPDGLAVLTPEMDADGATVAVSAVVRNQSIGTSEATLRTELLDAGGVVVAREETPVTTFPGDVLTVRRRLFVRQPQRWRLERPYLYTCRASLREAGEVIDEQEATFGIRSLSLDPQRGLRINGEPVLLRGACVHHDNGPLGAATIDRAEQRRVELLKAAGFNAIRSAHNPMSRAMLGACDRLGMLVMDETFDMWAEAKSDSDYSLHFGEWWEADVEAMVRKDVNHPSVILYSIGNEIPDSCTPAGMHIGRALADKVRALDGSRFVTQAVNGMMVEGLITELRESMAATVAEVSAGVNEAMTNMADILNEAMRHPLVGERTAEAFSYLDAAGYNYMHTRFEMDHERYPNRVIVASETQPSTVDRGWAAVVHNPHVIGDFTWTGWDYLGEAGIGRVEYEDDGSEPGGSGFLAKFPWLTAWCGDIDITGHRRPQSFYREIVFGLRTDPFLAVRRPELYGKKVTYSSPWSWSDVVSSWSWIGSEGAPVVVEVYADADEVELLLNGRSLGRQPAGAEHRYRAQFETTYEPGALEAVAWRSGQPIGRCGLRSADGPVRLAAHADRSQIAASASDLAFVELTLVDAAGTLHAAADRRVTVGIDGPGVLAGLGSARPVTEETFTDRWCTTFDGRALAVVRPIGAGVITVTATADGCEPQQVRIQSGG